MWGLEGGSLFYFSLGALPNRPAGVLGRGPWSSRAGRTGVRWGFLAGPFAPGNPTAGLFVWDPPSPLSLWVSTLACLSFYSFWFIASHVLGTPISRLAPAGYSLGRKYFILPPQVCLRARTEVRHPFYRNCLENCFML